MDSSTSIQDIANQFVNQTQRCVFLTGKAGTGKTTFLKNISVNSFKKTVVAAPTGIAAINAGGTTLHSLFQLPFGNFVPDEQYQATSSNSRFYTAADIFQNFKMNKNKLKLLREMELLIIDEVSMLRADVLDAIDVILKKVRRNANMPFGGLQILFIGDLLQLPPVINNQEWNVLKNYYPSPFFFDAWALKNTPPVFVELDKIYRQKNEDFVRILNNLRNNEVKESDIETLNQHYKANLKLDDYPNYILLTTHNHKADKVNEEKLHSIEGKMHTYRADINGDFNENTFPVSPDLNLKIGAQVMFVKNDPTGQQRFFNGKIGKVHTMDEDNIVVEFEDGSRVEVEEYKWENKRFELNNDNEVKEKIIGSFTTFPLKLAWAITVHKSQGLTFDKAIIDLEGAFAAGQVYVALSRLTSLDGLVLNSEINFNSIKLNSSVAAFTQKKPSKPELEKIAQRESEVYLCEFLKDVFNYNKLEELLLEHYSSYNKDAKSSPKQKHKAWAQDLHQKSQKIIQPSQVFQKQIQRIITTKEGDYLNHLYQRLQAAEEYFVKEIKNIRKEIILHLNQIKGKAQVKKYSKELGDLEKDVYEFEKKIKKALALCEATIDKRAISKKDILKKLDVESRNKQLQEMKAVVAKADEANKKLPNTKMQTLELFKKGLDIESIAQKRDLASSTIATHLCHFVKEGEIEAKLFMPESKIDEIVRTQKKLDSSSWKELKEALSDDFTYDDIRFALAHIQAKEAVKQE